MFYMNITIEIYDILRFQDMKIQLEIRIGNAI